MENETNHEEYSDDELFESSELQLYDFGNKLILSFILIFFISYLKLKEYNRYNFIKNPFLNSAFTHDLKIT